MGGREAFRSRIREPEMCMEKYLLGSGSYTEECRRVLVEPAFLWEKRTAGTPLHADRMMSPLADERNRGFFKETRSLSARGPEHRMSCPRSGG